LNLTRDESKGKDRMRSDYGLYVVAIICFIIVGAFAADVVKLEYWVSKISVTIIVLVIGIIAAVVGYSARPKAVMPKVEPTPAPATPPPPPPTPLPPVEEVAPELPPPPPPAPEMPAPTPAVTPPPEPKQPVKAAEEEKPKEKPVRRRRKKA